jgi:hypothetical protein
VTTSRRQILLLLALILVGAGYVYQRSPAPSVDGPGPAAAGASSARADGEAVADVKLDQLPRPGEADVTPDRNLFRFEARRSSAPPSGLVRRAPRVASPTGPPPPALPPPPPPIPLRFIGYLDQSAPAERLAVLSDGRGNVFSGKEGDIIEGRYRLLRIGTDSADLSYVDGRGQQTIRLSGQ